MPEDLYDWDKMCTIIADAEPWWEPGTRIGYHALTFGYVVGEIVRRATGKAISRVLLEEVASPLSVADELFFGVPESELGRLARPEEAEGNQGMFAAIPKDSPMFKLGPPECTTAAYGNRADTLAAAVPSYGTVTARAVARLYAALLGEVDGVRLISPDRLREVSSVAMTGVDQVFGFPTSWGLGYSIDRIGTESRETPTVFGVGGIGGSYAYADTATGTTFALTKNRLAPSFDTAEQVTGIVANAVAHG